VVVVGAGQQGLACVAAARLAGAEPVLAAGLAADSRRLELAERLGAGRTVESDREDLEAAVRHATGGEGASLVVLAAASPGLLAAAVRVARKRATIVAAGLGPGGVGDEVHRALIARHLTLKGVRGHQSATVREAIRLLESRLWPFGELGTHRVSLADADTGLELVGGEGRDAVHVTVSPKPDVVAADADI
jgi:threonine dehydrogenase-like Zn-dependent dehydrogenase